MRKYAYNYWSGGAGALGGALAGNAASGWLADKMGLKEPTSFGGRLARFGVKTLGTIGGAAGGALLGKTNWGPGGNQTAKEVPVAAMERAAHKKNLQAAIIKAREEKEVLRAQWAKQFPHLAKDKEAFSAWYRQQLRNSRAYNREIYNRNYERLLDAEYKARGFTRGQQTSGTRGLAAQGHNYLSDYASLGGDLASIGFGAMTIGGLGAAGYSMINKLRNRGKQSIDPDMMAQAIPDSAYQQAYGYNE